MNTIVLLFLISLLIFLIQFFMYNCLYKKTNYGSKFTDEKYKVPNGLWVLFGIVVFIPIANLITNLFLIARWFYLAFDSDYYGLPKDSAFHRFFEWFTKSSY